MVKPLLKKQNGSVSVAIPARGMQHDGYFVSSYSLNLEVNLVSLPLGPLTPKSPKVIKESEGTPPLPFMQPSLQFSTTSYILIALDDHILVLRKYLLIGANSTI